jgi:hypothetical protein
VTDQDQGDHCRIYQLVSERYNSQHQADTSAWGLQASPWELIRIRLQQHAVLASRLRIATMLVNVANGVYVFTFAASRFW